MCKNKFDIQETFLHFKHFIKAVKMDHFFHKIEGILLNKNTLNKKDAQYDV